MATVQTTDGDVQIRGNLRCTTINLPALSVGDGNVNGSDPITAPKLQHQYTRTVAQLNGTAATAERRVLHVAYGATGTVVAFRAGLTVAAVGDATVTVDLYKNGVSILSATISLTSATAVNAKVAGALSGTSYVTGDVFEAVIAVSAGTGTLPQGVFTDLVVREDAA
jgi:hypothetical protein